MKYPLILALLALLQTTGAAARAPMPPALQDFAAASLEIPQALIRSGISTVGKLDLVHLVEQIRGVEWHWFTGGFSAPPDGTPRGTANCDPAHHAVTVNASALPVLPAYARPAIALHEALCASGYRQADRDYAVSLSLYLMVPEVEAATGFKIRPIVEGPILGGEGTTRAVDQIGQVALGGGGTSVGGGGDAFALSAKLLTLMLGPPWAKGQGRTTPAPAISREAFFLQTLRMNFELIPEVTGPGVASRLSRLPSGGLRAQVPLGVWASQDMDLMVADAVRILEFIAENPSP